MSNVIYVLVDSERVKDPKTGFDTNTIDLYFPNEILKNGKAPVFANGLTNVVKLAIRTFAPKGRKILLMPRSSASRVLEHKNWIDDGSDYPTSKIVLANTIGLIDSDYRGEWQVRFDFVDPYYRNNTLVEIDGERSYFQAVPMDFDSVFKVVHSMEEIPESLWETERGEGGFGSSGK